MEEKVSTKVEWNPASGMMDPWDGSPFEDSGEVQKTTGMPREADSDRDAPSTGLPQDNSGMQARWPCADEKRDASAMSLLD